ncbi:TPA: hypothetical protein KDY05_002085 [Vibrio parahaemolyticus]|nr:hypothetical protein [Vibrio parahaemolyticus]
MNDTFRKTRNAWLTLGTLLTLPVYFRSGELLQDSLPVLKLFFFWIAFLATISPLFIAVYLAITIYKRIISKREGKVQPTSNDDEKPEFNVATTTLNKISTNNLTKHSIVIYGIFAASFILQKDLSIIELIGHQSLLMAATAVIVGVLISTVLWVNKSFLTNLVIFNKEKGLKRYSPNKTAIALICTAVFVLNSDKLIESYISHQNTYNLSGQLLHVDVDRGQGKNVITVKRDTGNVELLVDPSEYEQAKALNEMVGENLNFNVYNHTFIIPNIGKTHFVSLSDNKPNE